ncbi:MAG: WXG100 family type VII secretion target [Thermomicrobiales bacterium]|jgi:WXG100 family type VII secretion target|nr:WXG100 family type VII secretion target [Thermomicrobiales bacterium]
MSVPIEINPESLRSAGSAFESAAGQTKEAVDQVGRQMSNLESEWKGLASQTFYQQWSQWKTDMAKWEENLKAIGASLKDIATSVDEHQAQLKASIESMNQG